MENQENKKTIKLENLTSGQIIKVRRDGIIFVGEVFINPLKKEDVRFCGFNMEDKRQAVFAGKLFPFDDISFCDGAETDIFYLSPSRKMIKEIPSEIYIFAGI